MEDKEERWSQSSYHTMSVPKESWYKLKRIQRLMPIHMSVTQVLRMVINAGNEKAIKKMWLRHGAPLEFKDDGR